MMARLLLNSGATYFEGPIRITKGMFINAPKSRLRAWIQACGRGASDFRGPASSRNPVYGFQSAGITNLHFAELAEKAATSVLSQDRRGGGRRPTVRSRGQRKHEDSWAAGEPCSIGHLRKLKWKSIPDGPGVYWWYFPRDYLKLLGIARYCNLDGLRLRHAANGKHA